MLKAAVDTAFDGADRLIILGNRRLNLNARVAVNVKANSVFVDFIVIIVNRHVLIVKIIVIFFGVGSFQGHYGLRRWTDSFYCSILFCPQQSSLLFYYRYQAKA